MFDLAAFDETIAQVYGVDKSPADVRLARDFRGTPTANAVITYGPTAGMFGAALGLAMLAMPAMMDATSSAQGIEITGMTLEQFAMHMNMSVYDPQLVEMFEDATLL